MSSAWIILAAIATCCFSGVPGCFLAARSVAGQRVATLLMVAGSVLGLYGTAAAVHDATTPFIRLPWGLPWGRFAITIDPISALFLGLVFVVPALGSIYGLGYWKHSENLKTGRRLGLFYGLLAGSMALVVVARDGVLFLIAWEVMAVAAYFAATAQEDDPIVRRAGWVYLIATHVGTLCLIAMFVLWRRTTGSFALEPVQAISAGAAGAIFVLAVIGFGFKAGIMPLHVWLPGAHANAPSHVSAVMSGVMLKMGVYGIVRMTMLLPVPALWWGSVLLGLGVLTGVGGIVFALGQHDLKRLLAYSSTENIGIIVMGLGLALLGRSYGRSDWVVLGLSGALLHVWNHGLFKALMFFNAGAIIHATDTRDMDRLGGLGKRMPWVMGLSVLGAAAICALPPLNGFVSEWMLYIGLFRTLGLNGEPGFPGAAVAAVALALIGALAVACFVKLIGTVFLGAPRSQATAHAHDPQASMIGPMVVLGILCAAIGLFPMIAVPMLGKAVRTWAVLPDAEVVSITALARLNWISALGMVLVAGAGTMVMILWFARPTRTLGTGGTWDCGYAQPTQRMQYTGASFGRSLVNLFTFVLWPKDHRPTLDGYFPARACFKSVVPDVILDRFVLPLFQVTARYLPMVRVLQQGQTQLYVLYVLVILIVLLLWGAVGV